MKGISPLLASVLLIAVTVAIATLVMGWVSTVTRSTQTTVENKTLSATNCAAAAIVIDDVYITAGASGTTRVVVRNSGQTDDLAIASAAFYNTTGGLSSISTPAGGTDFDRGEVFTFTINATPVPACPTDFSKVIVTTNCGGVSAAFDRTPKCT